MILDLIVILLVIILSCLFCMNDKTNKQNCKLSHIVIGLTVIIFYKLIKYYKIKEEIKNTNYIKGNELNDVSKEKFTIDASLNEFISNTTDVIVNQDEKTLSDAVIIDYTKTINDLTNQIKKLNDNAAQQEDKTALQTNNNIDTISLENQQSFQQLQIDYLAKQIKSAQDIINQNTISNNAQNYKPIKIYSSCVANANGSLTTDTPVKDSFNSLKPLESVQNSSSSRQILNTSSQSSPGSPSNLDLPSLLQKLLQNN